MMWRFIAVVFCLAGCTSGNTLTTGIPTNGPDTTKIPLNDLTGTYLGFSGGLYPGGNTVSATHAAQGIARAKSIVPRDTNGNPTATGKYVLISIGMSNTTQEFCGGDVTVGHCSSESFIAQASADATVNKTTLAIVDGAQGGEDAITWTSPSDPTFIEAARRLAALGLSEKQVEIVWLKEADERPTVSLPDPNADAYILESRIGQILRAIKIRYPNIQQVFLTSRVYAGYATSTLNPEPYAYESGFSVKWLIQAQIDQMDHGTVDSHAGDLNYNGAAPWIAWGPYPWAAGMKPRSDGLSWAASDFGSDGTHPSTSGRAKVATMLLNFFKTSQFTRCWFVQGLQC